MNEPTTREIIQQLKARKAAIMGQKTRRPAYNKAFTHSIKKGDGVVFLPHRPKKHIRCITTDKTYEGLDAAGLGENVNSHSLSTAMSRFRVGKDGVGVTGTEKKGNRKEWRWVQE